MNNVIEGSCIALCYISLGLDLKIQNTKDNTDIVGQLSMKDLNWGFDDDNDEA